MNLDADKDASSLRKHLIKHKMEREEVWSCSVLDMCGTLRRSDGFHREGSSPAAVSGSSDC